MEFKSSLSALDSLVCRLARCWGMSLSDAKGFIENDGDYSKVRKACELADEKDKGN